jgi:OOP family OmpA-OmpF porin
MNKEYCMNKIKAAALAAVVGAAVAFPTVSQAQMKGDSHWYIGGGLGQADVKEADDGDTSMKIFGGYQINKNFAAELGYTDFGKGNDGGTEFKANAWELVGVGILPLAGGKFDVFGKLGFFWGEIKGGGASEDSVELTYGVGGSWHITPQFSLRAEYQRYTDVGNGASDVDVLGVNVVYRFK